MKHQGDPRISLAFLQRAGEVVELIGSEVYGQFEAEAQKRLAARDLDDWPILASALAFGCPIWTEDTDFFGCGVPIWTSDRVEIFLQQSSTAF